MLVGRVLRICARGFSSSTTSSTLTPLAASQILGVSLSNLDEARVLKSFRERALVTHPDVKNSNSTSTSGDVDFNELTDARDVLISALKESSTAGISLSDFTTSSSILRRPANVVDDYAEFAEYMADAGRRKIEELQRMRYRDEMKKPGRGRGLARGQREVEKRRGLARELKDGMDRAYFGPDVTPEVTKGEAWPWSFELEMRNLHKLPISGERWGEGEGGLIKGEGSFNNVLEIVVGRKMLGSVRRRGGEKGAEVLELSYGDGITTSARRLKVEDDENGGYTYRIEFFQGDDLIATVDDDGGAKHGLFGKVTGRMKERKRSLTIVRQGGEGGGRETHRIVYIRTPAVETGIVFNTNEEGKKGRQEVRIVHCNLPPSEMWAWEPRKGSHDIGGFTIEQRNRKLGGVQDVDFDKPMENWEGEGGIRPEILVLLCGYMTLDKERAKGFDDFT